MTFPLTMANRRKKLSPILKNPVLILFILLLLLTGQTILGENPKNNPISKEITPADGEETEEGSLDDFPKDFSTLKEKKEDKTNLYYGFTFLGGFEERKPLVGIELFLGYKGPFWGFLFNYPFIGHEHATQNENNYKWDKFTWKDSIEPDGYDYADEIGDIFWIFDHAYYELPTGSGHYSFYLKDISGWSWGNQYLINHFSVNTNYIVQNRKSFHGMYKNETWNILYLNDDLFDFDFHLIAVNITPFAKKSHWKNWTIETALFADTDPLDFNSYKHLEDKSHYKNYFYGGSIGSSLPLYSDINSVYLFDFNFQAIYNQSVQPYEIASGFSYRKNWIDVSLYGLLLSDLMKTPLFSPYFDLTRIEIAKAPKSGSKTILGIENIFRFYFAEKWTFQIRDRILSKNKPLLGTGIAYGKDMEDEFTFSFIFYRKNIVNLPHFVSSHTRDAITELRVGYLIFSKIGIHLDVLIEPFPDTKDFNRTARTKVDLRTKLIF